MATQLEILMQNVQLLRQQGASEADIKTAIRGFGYTMPRYERAVKRLQESGGKITPSTGPSNMLRGLTLGASDAVEAGARSLVGPETYSQERAALRLGEEEYAEEFPGRKLAQEIIGTVPTSIAASMLVPGAGPAVTATRLGNFARAAPVAAGEGAIAGYFGSEGDALSGEAALDAAKAGVAGLAFTGAGETLLGAKDAIRPAFNRAQEEIVGGVLRNLATDPQSAARNLRQNNQQLVPGSQPTTAQIARDPGLAAAETPIRGMDQSGRISQRLIDQQTARADQMQRLAGTEADLERLKAFREERTAPLRENAFAMGGLITDPEEIIGALDKLANRPGIKGRSTVRKIIERFRDDVKLLAKDPDDPDNLLPIDPRDLYAVRQEAGDLMSGRLGVDESAAGRLSRKELLEIQSIIDDEIEIVAPGFQNYLSTYRAKSGPVNRMETMQDLQRRSQGGINLQTDEPVLSAFKLRNAINARKKEFDRLPQSNKTRVNSIMRDLNRSTAATAPGVKVPGSDTFKNLSIAGAIGNIFGDGPLGEAAPRALLMPFQALYKATGSDERMQELLIQAMLDPELSARLLSRATTENVENFVQRAMRRLPAFFYGQGAAMVGMHVD